MTFLHATHSPIQAPLFIFMDTQDFDLSSEKHIRNEQNGVAA